MTTRSHAVATWTRCLFALPLLGVGLDHLEQCSADSYSVIPTIGTPFALNFASAALLAAGSLAGHRPAILLAIGLEAATIALLGVHPDNHTPNRTVQGP